MMPHTLFFFLAAGSLAIAQETPPPAPHFPLSLRAPAHAEWTISSTRKKAGGGADGDPFVQKLAVEKTAPIYHETATVAGGKSWEKWVIATSDKSFEFIKYAGDAGWTRLPLTGGAGNRSNYQDSDFEEFQWATAATYKGVSPLQKTPMYLFETNTDNGPLTEKEAFDYNYGEAIRAKKDGKTYGTHQVVTAYINPSNLMPAQFDNGSEVHAYSFGVAPSTRLALPPEVSSDLVKWVSMLKALAR